MADFTASVYQNEYLADGATEVHAVVSVTCSGAGLAGAGAADAAEMLIIDTSGSMDMPSSKIRAAREGAKAAVDEIVDGTWFAGVSANSAATMCFPPQPPMVRMDAASRTAAKRAIDGLAPKGATAIGNWLLSAGQLFSSCPATQRHAILLTDGKIEGEAPSVLPDALRRLAGVFQCDCRGIGADWRVDQLREIATALLGTVDIIAEPAELAADFETMIKASMGRGVAQAVLRLWTPQGSEIGFVRQVAPEVLDLTSTVTRVSPLIVEVGTGAWGDETRDYHISVKVPSAPVGNERLAARAEVVVDDQVVAKALVRAVWTDDANLTTRIDPAVAHYTGQTRLGEVIQQGLAARSAGRDDEATTLLGEAAKLAKESGNEATTRLLAKVVEVVDADHGTVRLRKDVVKTDEMALDARSTKTTRIRRETAP
ncbi:MAG: VWA domain-containing protein [Ilumatobacteraceae bacterium]